MIRFLLLFVFHFSISCHHPESLIYQKQKTEESTELRNKQNIFSESYKVVGVKDGDTFVLLINGKEQVVRFAHIDCPEKKQPFGTKAKHFVSDKCYGTHVRLRVDEKNKFDRYKRLIAEVILEDGTNLNKELVKKGLAWHFTRFSSSKEYEALEKEARAHKVGLWADKNPIAPWEWRRPQKKKTN